MSFNITEFISNLPSDGLRSNLFDIQINYPPAILPLLPVPALGPGPSYFSIRAKAASVPASKLGVAQTAYYGRNAKFGGNRTFDNWTITVLMDEDDYKTTGSRGIFELWISNINTHQSNIRTESTSKTLSYMGNALIYHKKKYGPDAAIYNMKYCYPIYVSPLQLDWGANDSIAEFQVTFAYQWWTKTVPSEIL